MDSRFASLLMAFTSAGFRLLIVIGLCLCSKANHTSTESEVETITVESLDWDYPILNDIPYTGFECDERLPGYYADDHYLSLCQVFHYCHHDGRMFDFLCPNSTIFNQKVFACDHFYNFQCETAKEFYHLNDLFYNVNATAGDY